MALWVDHAFIPFNKAELIALGIMVNYCLFMLCHSMNVRVICIKTSTYQYEKKSKSTNKSMELSTTKPFPFSKEPNKLHSEIEMWAVYWYHTCHSLWCDINDIPRLYSSSSTNSMSIIVLHCRIFYIEHISIAHSIIISAFCPYQLSKLPGEYTTQTAC